ncbi:hypothetical protein [Marimonas lutisalis]|uniref:hypothetical protein n=1 Tax=Marimonas lutisalis TaxID=2545756 RepID=UPI0010F58D05|nr:hypothetical protein [Marimonas lutisalis]
MAIQKVILHIGRHKSGTSALQQSLHLSRKALDSAGVLYPLAGRFRGVAHHRLANELHPRKTPEWNPELASETLAEIKDHHHTLILSSEGLQNLPSLERVGMFLSLIPHDAVQIICYVRELLDYAVSSYRQKIHNKTDFEKFGRKDRRVFDIVRFVEMWEQQGALTLAWFDRDRLVNGDIRDDFLERTGLGHLRDTLVVPKREINPSIGGNLLFFKAAANYLGQPLLSYNRLSSLANEHSRFRRAFRITKEEAQSFRERSNYNSYLVSRLGEVRMRDWSDLPVLPNIGELEEDFETLKAHAREDLLKSCMALADQAADWFRPQQD